MVNDLYLSNMPGTLNKIYNSACYKPITNITKLTFILMSCWTIYDSYLSFCNNLKIFLDCEQRQECNTIFLQ